YVHSLVVPIAAQRPAEGKNQETADSEGDRARGQVPWIRWFWRCTIFFLSQNGMTIRPTSLSLTQEPSSSDWTIHFVSIPPRNSTSRRQASDRPQAKQSSASSALANGSCQPSKLTMKPERSISSLTAKPFES